MMKTADKLTIATIGAAVASLALFYCAPRSTAPTSTWTDDQFEAALHAIDNDPKPYLAVYALSDNMDAAHWPRYRDFVRDLYLHHDEDARAAAVWVLAQRGESYDGFRADPSARVQATITRWDTGELPAEYASGAP